MSSDTEMEDMIRLFIEDDAPRFPRIPKVPLFMRLENQNMSDDFDPKVVSFGPYHHGKPELKFVEDFKPKSLQLFIRGSNKDEDFFLGEILRRIDEARSCYLDEFTNKYSDNDFARMMLLDACLTLNFIQIITSMAETKVLWGISLHLGLGVCSFIGRDMYLLENQVPFWILNLVFNLRFSEGGFEEILKSYCSKSLFGLQEPKNVANMEPQPSHLLELYHRVLVDQNSQSNLEDFKKVKEQRRTTKIFRPVKNVISKGINRLGCLDRYCSKNEGIPIKTESPYVFRSVMELKAKGIRFIPSGYGSLMDVRFTSHCYYAKVALPCWYVSTYTKVFFRNMIAYEICPGNVTEECVCGYIYFMRTLIISPNDAKELREKNIIISSLGSDEEVVQVFRALNTYGHNYPNNFKDVKEKIKVHYNSKSKTWIAELLDTYFTSPWSLIALVAATCLLLLTFLQTYYASPFHSSDTKS